MPHPFSFLSQVQNNLHFSLPWQGLKFGSILMKKKKLCEWQKRQEWSQHGWLGTERWYTMTSLKFLSCQRDAIRWVEDVFISTYMLIATLLSGKHHMKKMQPSLKTREDCSEFLSFMVWSFEFLLWFPFQIVKMKMSSLFLSNLGDFTSTGMNL